MRIFNVNSSIKRTFLASQLELGFNTEDSNQAGEEGGGREEVFFTFVFSEISVIDRLVINNNKNA